MEGILGENFTRDEVDASANLIQKLATGRMKIGLGDTIMTVRRFHRKLMTREDVAVEYFNNTKYQVSMVSNSNSIIINIFSIHSARIKSYDTLIDN